MCIVVAGSSLGGVCFPVMFTKLFKTVGFGALFILLTSCPILTCTSLGDESGRAYYLVSVAPPLSAWCQYLEHSMLYRVCHGTAILISRTRLPRKPMQRVKELVDFQGYKDTCYTLLAIGSFIVSLGVYSPYNYIREQPLSCCN